jgi:hypothetical protein
MLLYQCRYLYVVNDAANLQYLYEIRNKKREKQALFPMLFFVVFLICAIFAYEMKITKTRYLQGFIVVTVVLALVRCIFPSVAEDKKPIASNQSADSLAAVSDSDSSQEANAPAEVAAVVQDSTKLKGGVVADYKERKSSSASPFFKADGSLAKHRIKSVPCFADAFPDQNDVQLVAANKWGVSPVADREDAENRKAELVYVGSNPYFYIDKLHSSIPYLVPRASVLLQDIGRNYFDSLQIKGIPLHKIIVTSVMRSKADVEKLRGHNGNATQNSCHLYGTTFDVCYNRYKTVSAPGENRRAVRNDTLKWVLAEVLNDMRQHGRCYVKYEVKQGCFHITVR